MSRFHGPTRCTTAHSKTGVESSRPSQHRNCSEYRKRISSLRKNHVGLFKVFYFSLERSKQPCSKNRSFWIRCFQPVFWLVRRKAHSKATLSHQSAAQSYLSHCCFRCPVSDNEFVILCVSRRRDRKHFVTYAAQNTVPRIALTARAACMARVLYNLPMFFLYFFLLVIFSPRNLRICRPIFTQFSIYGRHLVDVLS